MVFCIIFCECFVNRDLNFSLVAFREAECKEKKNNGFSSLLLIGQVGTGLKAFLNGLASSVNKESSNKL